MHMNPKKGISHGSLCSCGDQRRRMDQEGMREVFSVATHQEAECRLDLDGGADAAAWIHSTAPPPKPGPLLVRRTTPTAACAGATAASSAAAVTAMAGGARGEEQRAGRRADKSELGSQLSLHPSNKNRKLSTVPCYKKQQITMHFPIDFPLEEEVWPLVPPDPGQHGPGPLIITSGQAMSRPIARIGNSARRTCWPGFLVVAAACRPPTTSPILRNQISEVFFNDWKRQQSTSAQLDPEKQ
uniref:Uncharacterized protein n=1 Tax=Setaria viridis TaxID=4556 RepID=A0A4V6D2W2_SETVI|nr:hypothetical protein SEVIR_8G090650v2 [Setaria viridis]TKW00177.1 hypothetical protein SEVIR_8G090650v2 [Setaria viridis]